jgi:hypothetical protein
MNAAERFTEVKMPKNSQDVRIALLEQSHTNIQEALSKLDKRFDSIEKRFDRIDNYLNDFRSDMHSIRQEGWAQMRWVLIFIIGFMGSPIVTALCKFIHIN